VTADDEDDGLKSLRAVWLSMPDEDPSDRGLADLMAAARTKATAMAKPSLWHRFLESMRRPPVLALATVMVLIGGAALIGSRTKDMDAQPTVSAPEAPAAERAESVNQAADEGGGMSAGSSAAAAPVDVVGGAAPGAGDVVEATPPPPPRPMKRPQPKGNTTTKSATNDAPKTTSTSGRARRDDDAMLLDADGEAEKRDDKAKKESASSVETRPHAGSTSGALAAQQAPNDSASLSSTGPTSVELHQLARKLVARGDCKSAHTLTARIAKQDPAYYKAKIVPDKAFDRCVLAQ
jgi:hypothetical protein